MNIDIIGNKVLKLAEKTGAFISGERIKFNTANIESKGFHDFVSYVDKQAEQMIVDGLKIILPQAGFITEEKTANNNNEEYIWIIDPLDGTTNFIHNLTPHAVSIALQHKSKTILGVVYELGAGEMFYSWKGISAFCNNKIISVSKAEKLSDSLIATGFHINDFSRLQNHLKVVESVVENSHGIRRHGSAATDLAYVATGRFEGFFEYGLSVWDIAAGAFIVEQAGGKVSDYSGENNYFYGREIIAGTQNVHNDLLNIVKKVM
jgi:myo-inositol-1(or 4)-monophosphatase